MKYKLPKICLTAAVALCAATGLQTSAHAQTIEITQTAGTPAAAPPVRAFDEMVNMNNRMEDFFNGFPGENIWMDWPEQAGFLADMDAYPATDVIDSGGNFVIRMALAGRAPKDIHISIARNYISIKGTSTEKKDVKGKNYLLRENSGGAFERTITLPQTADAAQARATYKEGMLTITVPKKAVEKTESRNLPIKDLD
ncbi:MAG: Hsp20/alpha crystallin family protein [Alphaproteobacteria bacterium]|nr:Hsp20/alpha crystallin family protein [Alphaproteobacteria bacterium]